MLFKVSIYFQIFFRLARFFWNVLFLIVDKGWGEKQMKKLTLCILQRHVLYTHIFLFIEKNSLFCGEFICFIFYSNLTKFNKKIFSFIKKHLIKVWFRKWPFLVFIMSGFYSNDPSKHHLRIFENKYHHLYDK